MRKHQCPCVVPGAKFAWRGQILKGAHFLALQGLSPADVQRHGLHNVPCRLQRSFAGNAFTATVCGSVLLACVLAAETQEEEEG